MALQWMFLLLHTPLLAAQNHGRPSPNSFGKALGKGQCKAPSDWDSRLQLYPEKNSYDVDEVVQLSCTGKFLPSVPEIQCISRGAQIQWNEAATCKDRCQQPEWDSQLQLSPNKNFYRVGEEVTLSCFLNDAPPLAVIRCANRTSQNQKDAWELLETGGTWFRFSQKLTCLPKAKCQKPQWDSRLQFSESRAQYPQNRELTLTCPKDLVPSFSEVKCTKLFQRMTPGKPAYVDAWWGRKSSGAWTRVERNVLCMEVCQRPVWDYRLQLQPDQENYAKNQEVMLRCPEGFQPTYTEIKCQSGLQHYDGYVSPSVYKDVWHGKDSRGAWVPIQSSVECIEVLQVDPQTFEISSTSIKVKWTCRFPDACQGMRAMCRLAAPSSPPCEAEEVKGEQMLHGQEGTVTCSPLQPFTEYSVTINLPHYRTLFSWLFMTEQAVPDKPEQLWLDPDRGSLRWNSLPSCNGEIIGYQLNITARNAGDSSVLETERLRLNGSVTELRLPEHSPGSSYSVTIQGLTAAGAGAALLKEFHTSSSSDTPRPQGISCRSARDIAPSQGTAVLDLSPIARGSEAASEHQLIVVPTHNDSAIESICSGQPQLLNASIYVAAVLNLSAPRDFVLGDGSRGQGEHNAALRPGCDYTALLRLVRLSPQAEKFTCVCYSFSVVAGQTAGQWHGIVIGLVVLLAVRLVTAVILWFVLSRKRKYLPNKTKEDN